MSCEIELKAHINENDIEFLINKLKKLDNCKYLGEIDKKDIYWTSDTVVSSLFRTRFEESSSGKRIYFTSKPLKKKDYNIEYNVENEFEVCNDQWDKIIEFCEGLNLNVCRRKYKKGHHFEVLNGMYIIHCEVLNVKYLGWFIEAEIVGDNIEKMNKEEAETQLYSLLNKLDIPSSSIEPRGYNKLLKEVGHEKG